MVSKRRSTSSSVVPPVPSEVFSLNETPACNSTPSSFSRAASGFSLIRIRTRHLGSKQHGELVEHAPNAAGADGKDCVTRTRFPIQKFHPGLHGAGEDYILVARRADGFGQNFAVDAFDRSFPGRLNFRLPQNIGLIERATKIFPEKLGARITVRLKQHEQAFVTATARGFERGANFGGMMAVIVNQGDAAKLAFDFEAPAYAGKLCEARANQVCRDVERKAHGGSRSGVAHVVNSRRRRQPEDSEIVVMIFQAKLARESDQPHFADDQVRLARCAVSDHRTLYLRQNRLHVRLVDTEDHRAVKRTAVRKLQKNFLNFLQRMVMVQMLAVDGGDYGQHRSKQQERAVAFVRFDHHVFALA